MTIEDMINAIFDQDMGLIYEVSCLTDEEIRDIWESAADLPDVVSEVRLATYKG